jgi:hypothetical protein
VQFIDAPANGLGIITNLIAWAESHIERFIVGQSMSSGADNEGSLGGSGRADFAENTKIQKVMGYKESLEDAMSGCEEEPGIVSLVKKHTYPWADFGLRFKLSLQDQDPAVVMSAVQGAAAMGVTFQMDEVRALTGLSKPTESDQIVGGVMQQPQEGGDPGTGADDEDELTDEEVNGMFGEQAEEGMTDQEVGEMMQ